MRIEWMPNGYLGLWHEDKFLYFMPRSEAFAHFSSDALHQRTASAEVESPGDMDPEEPHYLR